MAELRVGVVAHRTGRLHPLGGPLAFAMARWREALTRTASGDRLRWHLRDSLSTTDGVTEAAARLVRDERVHLVVTLGGTQLVPAVVAACRRLAVPCVSTTLPWQVYRDGTDKSAWAHHFCWGLDDIAGAFADAWQHIPGTRSIGCLWNDGAQGTALRDPAGGFLDALRARGFTPVDPGGYREDRDDFAVPLQVFRAHGTRVVTAAATGADLGRFHRLARATGVPVELVTCSRWLSYPAGAERSGINDVVTPVYWSPSHPYRCSVTGLGCAELATAYQRATGREWLQPLGLAYALGEIARHALGTAADPTDPARLAEALSGTRLATIAGPVDWTAGPEPRIALVPLVTGQWQPTGTGRELVIVANRRVPGIPIGGALRRTG